MKKLHRHWLEMGIIDVSQNSHWRKQLFESAPGETFIISIEDTAGLRRDVSAAVRRYKLHFTVRKAESSEAEAWLSEYGHIVFKFWATSYPTVRAYSGNNPAIV
jgi:hypothetical protein